MYGTFKNRPDGDYTVYRKPMPELGMPVYKMPIPLSGMKTPKGAFAAIVKGMRYAFDISVENKNGEYAMFHRFVNDPDTVWYEDIIVDYYPLSPADATYSGVGRAYRKYQLGLCEVRPLKERVKESPTLLYAAQSPELRIRQGWKPVPSPVAEQTPATEPAMRVKIPFSKVCGIIDAMKREGVDNVNICLVGWQIRGHDGRWPQVFPVEPSLGGEAGLKAAIAKAKGDGYRIAGHMNHTGAYRIADCWDESYIAKNPDGSLVKGTCWSGGQAYEICYKCAYEKFAQKANRELKDLGFDGMHFIDVFSIVLPVKCSDPRHPVNEAQAAEYAGKSLEDARQVFGAIASEGVCDFVAAHLDYGMYVTFELMSKRPPLIDKYVPIWEVAYHGIILSNPGTETVNFPIKDKISELKVAEVAGRPLIYFNSSFRDDASNWMGSRDLSADTPEGTEQGARAVKTACDMMKKLGYLQLEFLEDHAEISKDVFKSKFSDGSEIVVNYSDKPFVYGGDTIASMDYKLFKPAPVAGKAKHENFKELSATEVAGNRQQ